MQRNFISLQSAEKLVNKSRATLVRLCNKINEDGHSRKDGSGAWQIDKGYLLQYYGLSERKADPLQNDTGAMHMQSLLQSLFERIKDLAQLNTELSRQNRELLEENRRLLSAPSVEPSRRPEKDYTPIYFAVLAVIVIALVIYLVFFPQ
jgi:hypothetical protein